MSVVVVTQSMVFCYSNLTETTGLPDEVGIDEWIKLEAPIRSSQFYTHHRRLWEEGLNLE